MPPARKWIQPQAPMRRVLIAASPLMAFAVYAFGWRAAALLLVCNAAAFLTEYAFVRAAKQPVSQAVFVTACLFALSLPPPVPLWMAVVGVVFGVLFGKMAFGGFGRNVFNPALTGRAFLYVSFGRHMTGIWSEPFQGGLAGFAAWQPDAVTQATPGMLLKSDPSAAGLWEGLIGLTSGTLGGTSALLAAAGGLYLLWTRTANYRIVTGCFAGYLLTQVAIRALGVPHAAPPFLAMLNGSFVVGAFFYATDPVSASQTDEGRWLYGLAIGMLSSLISVFSAWPAGTMFAILLANMFAPIADHVIRQWKAARKGAA